TLSELEVFGQHGEGEFEVNLTLVIRGRGALFVSQMKSMVYPQLVEPYRIAAERGEWEGGVTVTHTYGPLPNCCGLVIGGTGEFAGMTGRQQQTTVYKRIKGNVTFVETCETFWLTEAEKK